MGVFLEAFENLLHFFNRTGTKMGTVRSTASKSSISEDKLSVWAASNG